MAKLDTMRDGHTGADTRYERIAGAEPNRLLTFHAPESVFGIDAMAGAGHAAGAPGCAASCWSPTRG